MTTSFKLLGAGLLLLLVAILAAVIATNVRDTQQVTSEYIPPKGIEIVKGSGPLGCDFSDVDSPILTGTLHQLGSPDTKIQLPGAYLPGPFYPKNGQLGTEGTLLMQMQIETFKPYPTENMRGKIAKGEDDWIMLLITQVRPFEWIAQFVAEFNSGKPKGTKFPEIPQENGLLKLDYTPLLRMKEAFVARDGNQVTDVIDCYVNNDPHTKLYPNCTHTTSASGIDISITYPVRELNNWKAIRERARKFIACMIVDSNVLEEKEN